MQIRINKYLSTCEIGSRRAIEEMLWNREFSINGRPAKPGELINPEKDKITHNGRLLQPTKKFIYIAVNKPAGILSTTNDELHRKNILSLVRGYKERLYPIGRLDKESTGLMILTNDGDLTLKLTHPRYHLPKTYEVTTIEPVTDQQIETMANGMDLPGGKSFPTEVKRLTNNSFEIILHQGMKRQIREMCELVGLTVNTLHRTKIGSLKLGSLKTGSIRELSEEEISELKKQLVAEKPQPLTVQKR